MKLVIIESPFAADSVERAELHLRYARAALRDSLDRGEAPFASHLLYTRVLDDDIPAASELKAVRVGLSRLPYRRPRAGLPPVLRAGGIFRGRNAMTDETKPKQPWTPGTWEVFGGRLIRSVEGGSATPLAELATPYRPGIGLVRGEDEFHANGVLMVAAPVMAEALALFLRVLDDGRGPRVDPLRLALDRDRSEKSARAALDLCGWRWS